MISEEYMIEKLVDITPPNISLKGSQITDFHYRAGSLEIIVTLDGVNSDFRFFFDWTHSFRVTDEGDLLKMLGEQKGKMRVGIYKVEDSSYLEWFNDQSFNIHEKEKIIHYLIVTVNDIIDVLSSESPVISNCSK